MSSQRRTRLTSLSLPTPRGPTKWLHCRRRAFFKFVALHAVFNQQELWEAFIDEGIVSYSDRSIKEAGIPSLLRRFKRNGKKTRSSNYRAIQLQQISADGGELGEMRRLLRPYGTHCLRKSLWSVFPMPLGMSLTLSPAGRPGR